MRDTAVSARGLADGFGGFRRGGRAVTIVMARSGRISAEKPKLD